MGFYVNVTREDGVDKIYSDAPIIGHEVLARSGGGGMVVAWRVNRILRPMSWVIEEDADVEFVDTSSFEGAEIYRNTLIFLLVMACRKELSKEVTVRYSMSNCYYCEIPGEVASDKLVSRIKAEMGRIVASALPIQMAVIPRDKAVKIFSLQGNEDKAKLIRFTGADPVALYQCDGVYGFFGVPLAASTDMLEVFDLNLFAPGFLLRFPSISEASCLPPLQVVPKLMDVFREYSSWLDVLGLSTMHSLHERVARGKSLELILISEAFHGEALARVANRIIARKTVRLLCLAGPSSSGKTTTSKRLAIQLQVCGKNPVALALDDYYVDRDKTPRDESGNFDFEAIEALDIDLINEHISALLSGEEVEIPKFDFVTGTRKRGRKMRLSLDDILIIEGIHGLNDRLTHDIAPENKYKVFISPLTGVNLDSHNRIGTTDTRLIRRMVRDHRTRGHTPEHTIMMWPSVIKGSHKHIFPYEEEADMLFNSSLVYEISVLKGYAEPLLRAIDEDSPAYGEASRLLSMLGFAPVIPSENVPNLSILREFIGGGCFED
ncbi:MAG: nucleoside kinase [Synergistaceae bacterium]|jgi:uridine kinase|nr:nucleoside kinase [Synergistaceae bacterium]